MNARTAIIILNWNSREMTAECIRSVLSMEADEYELIVVDNGSQDGSPEYLQREFPQCTLLPQTRNLGFAAGCNVAFREAFARGMKYVLPLNNDTIVDRHFLKELVKVAEQNPQVAIVSPKIYFYDSPERFWWAGGKFSLWTGIPTHIGRKERDAGQFDHERPLDWATGCALLMRCAVLQEIGVFDEHVSGNGEDLDLSIRARRAGFEIRYAPKAKLWHKEGVDFRKNAGEHARKFTATRSLLWIMHRYAGPLQWISFLPNFLFRHFLFYVLLSLWRGDFRSAWAVVRGMGAFGAMRIAEARQLKTNHTLSGHSAEAAARVGLVRYGWKRLALSRMLEAILWPMVRLSRGEVKKFAKEPAKILVMEFWNLGDLVMITPFLKNLRLHYPASHIAILTSPRVAPLLENQGLVDELITVRVPWAQHMSRWRKYVSRHWVGLWRSIRELRAGGFNLGFSGRADARENFLLWVAGIERRVGYGFGHGASFLTDVVKPDVTRPHLSDRWLHLLEHLGKPVLDRQPALSLTNEERRAARQLLDRLGVNDTDAVIAVHPGARNEVRQWGEEKFLEVARRLAAKFHVRVLWFREPGSQSAGVLPPGFIPLELPLRSFLGVLLECRLLICNDTGPMHLASALRVPVVAAFGPTMPAWFGPRGENSRIVLHEGVWCRPCFDYCRFDQPYCLRLVSVDAVFKAATQAIRGQVNVLDTQRLESRAAVGR